VLGRLARLIGDGALGAASGLLAGLASFVFLEALDAVTELRVEQGWLIWLLPPAGLVVGLAVRLAGARAAGGTALAVGEARRYTEGTPGRMAPLGLFGTLLGHLVGASVGREGTAVQMAASLTDSAARAGRLDRDRRAVLARAALAGGFGSVFGVPWAGLVFALEASRRRSPGTLVAAAAASFVGHAVVVGLGHEHATRPSLDLPFGPLLPLRLLLAGLLFGVAARVFHSSLRRLRRRFARHVTRPELRPMIGGAATLGLALLVGRDSLGLSLPLIDDALGGVDLGWWVPWLKLLFTVVALGSGFLGGEVTPLFVVGATLGAVAAGPLGIPQAALASIGFVSVFGAAARVHLTAAVMAAELFGWQALLPALFVTWVARAVAGRRGLYDVEAASPTAAR
jgi:H+/Cl- antiporter ClcA